jgi:hypothetical protein
MGSRPDLVCADPLMSGVYSDGERQIDTRTWAQQKVVDIPTHLHSHGEKFTTTPGCIWYSKTLLFQDCNRDVKKVTNRETRK